MTLAWIIGSGGMLGSALERCLRRTQTPTFATQRRFAWDDEGLLIRQMAFEAERFGRAAAAADGWEVYWAAGIGTMGSTEDDLRTETLALAALCQALEQNMRADGTGRIALASSAGAIYAGSRDPVVDEFSEEGPTTAYARAKLEQERLVRVASSRLHGRGVIGRISTLYGAGQDSAKQQGLMSHIARSLVFNRPVKIFVPMDTIRDYIAVDDAAVVMVETLRAPGRLPVTMKIVASERPVTISEILSTFKRVSRRPPRVVTSSSPLSASYARRIQFRSVVPPIQCRPPQSLMIGISQLLAAERARFVQPGGRARAGSTA